MNLRNIKETLLSKDGIFLVSVISLLITIILICATWDINFWPTDAKYFYFEPTVQVPNLKYISQIHETFDQDRVRWLHGKEMFIISASIVQRILRDFETLRPFIIVCLFAVCFSSILVFLIAKNYWGQKPAFLCYFLVTFSFWPYIYVLFAKHQPLGMMFFLLSYYFMQISDRSWRGYILNVLSGGCLCIALFSSSIAIVYFPFYIIGFFRHFYVSYKKESQKGKSIKHAFYSVIAILLGFAALFIYFNYPNIIHNVKSYIEYVGISSEFSHFVYNQRVLQQWIPIHLGNVRGGWLWVFKYFFLVMPVLFPFFILCNLFLVGRLFFKKSCTRKTVFTTIGIILLSWSQPLFAEIPKVSQYGANYFASFLGVVFLLGYASYVFKKEKFMERLALPVRRILSVFLLILAVLYLGTNLYVFCTDIYPARMASTFLSRAIEDLNVKEVYTYRMHSQKTPFTEFLSPSLLKKITIKEINSIQEVNDGYVIIPPVTGDSIFVAATGFYNDYDKDIFLSELIRKENIDDYSVASFKTLAGSRIWPNEEEVLSYRFLILNHFNEDIVKKGKVWLLDAKKYQEDISNNFPSKEYMFLLRNRIYNIGKKETVYTYKGFIQLVRRPHSFQRLRLLVHKVGNPQDELKAYIYKQDEGQQHLWVPFSEDFISKPIEGANLTNNPRGAIATFNFNKKLLLNPGLYYITIYRTGPRSDKDYYRIYSKNYMQNETRGILVK